MLGLLALCSVGASGSDWPFPSSAPFSRPFSARSQGSCWLGRSSAPCTSKGSNEAWQHESRPPSARESFSARAAALALAARAHGLHRPRALSLRQFSASPTSLEGKCAPPRKFRASKRRRPERDGGPGSNDSFRSRLARALHQRIQGRSNKARKARTLSRTAVRSRRGSGRGSLALSSLPSSRLSRPPPPSRPAAGSSTVTAARVAAQARHRTASCPSSVVRTTRPPPLDRPPAPPSRLDPSWLRPPSPSRAPR